MKKITFTNSLLIAFCCFFIAFTAKAQFAFTNSNSRLNVTTHSGNCISVVDVNNDGLDDILIMDQSNTLNLELQHADGTYTNTNLGTVPGGGVWGMSAADVDHNGWKDVATGAGACYLYKLFYSGGIVTATITQLAGGYFVQNITFGDFNNDGWVDLEVCDDNDYAKIYQNTAGTLNLTTTLINTNINPGMYVGGDPYDSGNYGSVWTDFDNDGDLDLYIAHCRQSAGSNTDVRRRDRLFVNNGSNVFTEAAQSYGIEVTDFKQTWTTSFGDMDNDGDFDIVMTNHGENSQIMQNDGTGHFTDITAGSNFSTNFDAIESMVEDFDNDGYLDILISGPNWIMYHNNHDGTYTQTPGVFAGVNLLSFATGDLNHDGKIDLFASYGNVYNSPSGAPDVLYLNTVTNTNHFITFALTGTVSNPGAIGARVTIYSHTGAWGPTGKQIREVRAGESYGTSNSMQLHFGLGADTFIDSARIDWPSGIKTHFTQLAADQFVSSIESTCSITGNFAPSGAPTICTGQSDTLLASSGFASYLWSNGDTTSYNSVSSAGSYSVQVSDGLGCTNLSPAAIVLLNPDETPTVAITGLSSPCSGTVTLTSSSASSYSWSGPSGFTATSQAINPTQSGAYTVAIQGLCGTATSLPTTISLLAAPTPAVTGATGLPSTMLTLSASGSGTFSWYDQPTGGTLLGTGSSYTTPSLTNTTTYYVDQTTTYPGAIHHAGQLYHTGAGLYSPATTNGNIIFNVLSPCILNSVKVYTDTAGARQINLINSSGVVIDSLLINIPVDSTVINLNWSLPVGTAYQLTTKTSINTTNFFTASPRLQRSNGSVTYPYTINNLVSLVNSNQGAAYYYYFYDWVVQEPSTSCTSSTVPVVANISGLGINTITSNNGIEVYPNPASDLVNVKFENSINTTALIELTDIAGRLVNKWSVDKPVQGQQMQLNVSDVAQGTYLITIKTDTKKVVQKLVLTK